MDGTAITYEDWPSGEKAALTAPPLRVLAAQAEALDQIGIACFFFFLQIIKQTATLADHFQKAAAGVIILPVIFEMFGKIGNPLRRSATCTSG